MALRGDLADASPAELLSSFADQHASGCLAIERATRPPGGDPAADTSATLHLRNGSVYAATLAGGTFLVGTRLVTSHALAAAALAEALEAQRSDLAGWRLGEILVQLGHIHADIVEKISIEQVLEIATEVSTWRNGSWKFRSGERTRALLAHPLSAADLLRAVQARSAEWRELLPTVGGRHAPLVRTSATVPLSSSRELVGMLRAADELSGEGGLEACSHTAGVSLLEGARLVVAARAAGLLGAIPVVELIAVGDWPTSTAMGTTAQPSPTGLTLAPRLPAATAATFLGSYALARLLELDGPVRLTGPETDLPAAPDAADPDSDAPTPEQIVADLVPEAFEDSGHEATVLDLGAARAARSAELAGIEETATESALTEQLEREQSERDAEGRAPADALRQAAEARAAVDAAANRARIAQSLELADAEAVRSVPELPAAQPPAPEQQAETLVNDPVAPVKHVAAHLTAGERLGMFSVTRDPLADTASLMRELSSLGEADDASTENRPASRPIPAIDPKAAPEKKRKGFFGR